MKKGRAIIGLNVLEEKEGMHLGKVIDILYTGSEGRVIGLMVETAGASLPEMRFVQLTKVKEITKEAVFIESKDALQAPQCLKNNDEASFSAALLSGQHIYSELGKEKGIIKDVLIDLTSGKVEGYQVSGGIIADLVSGRNVIPVSDVITMGKDMIIMKD